MDISFQSEKLEQLFNDDRQLKRQHGAERARRIMKRLDELDAAQTLEDMRKLTGRCHELKGDRTGQLALDLDHPYRLIFVPDHNPIPTKEDGGLDWKQVTAVKIVEVVDYHD